MSIHDNGSVTLATAVGRQRAGGGTFREGWQITAPGVECAVADHMAMVRATAEATGNGEYDVRIRVNWAGEQPLEMLARDSDSFAVGSVPLHHYSPVETTVNAAEPDLDYAWHVYELALDCVNQGGVSVVRLMRRPAGRA